jgi:1-deoxy-D-xylulose-5-phosphate synthase
MCVDRAGAVGSDGDTHQGLYDMSLFKCIPNIIIMSPKNFIELESMMEFAITLNRPVAIRYPRGSESKIKMSCSPIKFCKAELLSSGNDLTIILIGNSVAKGIELANLLKNNNIYSDVINCRFLKPIDEKLIVKSIKKTGNVIVIEDGSIIGGLSSSVKEIIADNNLTNVNSSFYAYPDQFVRHGTVSELEKYYKIDVNYIYKQIKKSKTFKDKFSK